MSAQLYTLNETHPNVFGGVENELAHDDSVFNFVPPPICEAYLKSVAPVSIIMGPLGSAKTSTSVQKIIYHAMRTLPSRKDGLRKSRWVVIRNTSDQLRDTSIKTFHEYYPSGSIGIYKEFSKTYYIRFQDVYAEVLFRALDRPEDVRKLLSLDITGAFFNELREIDWNVFTAARSRCGRFPQAESISPELINELREIPYEIVEEYQGGRQLLRFHSEKHNHLKILLSPDGSLTQYLYDWAGVMADTNPPDIDSWLYNLMEEPIKLFKNPDLIPENWAYFKQPGGFEEGAENLNHLPPGYYDNLLAGADEEWARIHVHAKYGTGKSGKPVYEHTFNKEFHVAKATILNNPALPIGVGLDFGRTPAAVIKQRWPDGTVVSLREVIGDNIGIENFLDLKLLPVLRQFYPNQPVYISADPAGAAKTQADEESLYEKVEKRGLVVVRPYSNKVEPRINATENLLRQNVAGKALYQIDPDNCPTLVTGFVHGYKYRKKRDGDHEDKPSKNEYSHVHDANQYIDMVIDSGLEGQALSDKTHEVKIASMDGWL